MNTTVFIVWAMQNTDATSGSPTLGPQHGDANSNMRGISPRQYNLITEAMAAAMTPTTTIMMMPSPLLFLRLKQQVKTGVNGEL